MLKAKTKHALGLLTLLSIVFLSLCVIYYVSIQAPQSALHPVSGRQAGGLGLMGQDAEGVGPGDGRADLYLHLRRHRPLRSGGTARAHGRRG